MNDDAFRQTLNQTCKSLLYNVKSIIVQCDTSHDQSTKIVHLFLQTCDIDVDKEVEKEKQSEPYIVVAGKPGLDNTQFFIACEQAILFESKSLRDALVDLIATYYVFNISYPKSVCGVMLFFQHFIFNLKDKQKQPPCLTKLYQNLSTLDEDVEE